MKYWEHLAIYSQMKPSPSIPRLQASNRSKPESNWTRCQNMPPYPAIIPVPASSQKTTDTGLHSYRDYHPPHSSSPTFNANTFPLHTTWGRPYSRFVHTEPTEQCNLQNRSQHATQKSQQFWTIPTTNHKPTSKHPPPHHIDQQLPHKSRKRPIQDATQHSPEPRAPKPTPDLPRSSTATGSVSCACQWAEIFLLNVFSSHHDWRKMAHHLKIPNQRGSFESENILVGDFLYGAGRLIYNFIILFI